MAGFTVADAGAGDCTSFGDAGVAVGAAGGDPGGVAATGAGVTAGAGVAFSPCAGEDGAFAATVGVGPAGGVDALAGPVTVCAMEAEAGDGAFSGGWAAMMGGLVMKGAVLSPFCVAAGALAPAVADGFWLSVADVLAVTEDVPPRLLDSALVLAGCFGVAAVSLAGGLVFLVMLILLSWL